MSDEITLTVPRERDFYGIARLVVAGLASRLDVGYESLEDIQVALQGVLDRPGADQRVTLRVRVEGDALRAALGPFDRDSLRRELEDDSATERLGLRRLLDTVVDDVELGERDGGEWIELTKRVDRTGGAAG